MNKLPSVLALAAALVLASVLAAFAPPALAAGPRHGVITDLQPIENRGEDESEVTQKKRKFGSLVGGLAGLGAFASGKARDPVTSSIAQHGAQIGEETAARVGSQGPTTRYMVKVKLDSGKTLSITQLREQVGALKVGSRVRVEGKGDEALVYGE